MSNATSKPMMPYIERDESWMYFNRRLLSEAAREDLPLFERLNFMGIYSSNLDEFFRVRIASLRRLSEHNTDVSDDERQRARQTLVKLMRLNPRFSADYEQTLSGLFSDLDKAHIHIISERELLPNQAEEVRHYYMEHISSRVNPIFICSKSFVPDRHLRDSLYLLVSLSPGHVSGTAHDLAIIEIPSKECGRFVRLSDQDGESYLMFVDDVLRFCLPYIFAGLPYETFESYTFKVTKDSEIELDNDLRSSVIEQVSRGLKRRNRGEPIRLIYDAAIPSAMLDRLVAMVEIDEADVRIGGGRYHDMKDLIKMPDCGRPGLRYPRWQPRTSGEDNYATSILERILEGDLGIHFPYESFDQFLRILREAAFNPTVREIRISLYRVAQNSKVVKALMAAAKNGKRVTAVVELLARFDEQSNINWSKKMQEAGVHVVFGHEKLKIHSKLVHLVTTRGDIACIGTGNMHEGNAQLYTDYMLLTADKVIAQDVLRVFDFIERPFLSVRFQALLVAPNDMRHRLVYLIQREIRNAQAGLPAYIKLKLNHVVDETLVRKLYEASEAGVDIDLCVRGSCSLVPGVEGFSSRIRINGIIDRYLEHARIYIFANGGAPEYYLGSTDWMPRNLDKRIEVMTPVYAPTIQHELATIVDLGLRDTAQGYYVNEHGGMPKRLGIPKAEQLRSQEILYHRYNPDQRHG